MNKEIKHIWIFLFILCALLAMNSVFNNIRTKKLITLHKDHLTADSLLLEIDKKHLEKHHGIE